MSASGQVLSRGAFLSHEKDYNHATDAEYLKYRQLADKAYQLRNKYSQESQSAYKNGDKSGAHELSVKAKEQLEIAESYSRKAAEYVFVENNADSDSNEIDLHGLYVKELEYILKQRIMAGINRNESKLEVIVGKGLHSANGVAKLKPAVEDLCSEANLKHHIDRHNTGVLVIDLTNAKIPSSWSKIPPMYNGPPRPQGTYQQPQYQQQPQYHQPQHQNNTYHQQQQQHNNNDNGKLAIMVIKLICACINKR